METSTQAVLLYSLAGGAILIYLPFFAVGWGRLQVGYDYQSPRAMLEKLPAYAKRATWAHQNGFESFTFYAPAAISAYVTQVDSQLALSVAIAYVIARFFYPIFYITNIAPARSLMFAIGSLSSMILYGLSILEINSSL
ncbi:MAPEG family protein [Dactylococcopsis salina]|uniref:Membrane protein n=1 Tax=Dactylococcopsis salina (strain PCC 8305) TaxID=13035 RepID=K9YPQ8_DACS8|nr:MAPEG family protein [Dactylococcopsis salina]AFZ48859.1 putative membrane protein [Dactylococcopsis salina PCC 8305]